MDCGFRIIFLCIVKFLDLEDGGDFFGIINLKLLCKFELN